MDRRAALLFITVIFAAPGCGRSPASGGPTTEVSLGLGASAPSLDVPAVETALAEFRVVLTDLDPTPRCADLCVYAATALVPRRFVPALARRPRAGGVRVLYVRPLDREGRAPPVRGR